MTLRAPMALSRVSVHRAGRHRVRHPGRPDDGRADCQEGLLRRSEGPAPRLTQGDRPRFSARSITWASPGKWRSDWPSTPASASRCIPKTIDVKGDGVEEVLFDPFEVPDGDNVRLTLDRRAGRGEGRAGDRGADPAVGRAGVRLGVGDGERRRDGLRRPAAGPGVREPRDAGRRLADAPAAADRAGPGAGRRDLARCWPAHRCDAEHLPAAAEHDGRPGVATCSRRPRRWRYLRDGPRRGRGPRPSG